MKLTAAEHFPGSVPRTTLAGQPIAGACVSITITVNEPAAELFEVSLTEQFTVVVPFANSEPDGGVQIGVRAPPQLSPAVAVYVTTAVQRLASVECVMSVGSVNVGASISSTVTVKEQFSELPAISLTEQFTVVVPFANAEPDGGEHIGVRGPSQLSVAVAVV